MNSAFRRINHQGQKLGKPFALSTGSRVLRPLNSVIRLLATEAWIQLPDVSHGKPLYLTTTQGNSKGSTLGVVTARDLWYKPCGFSALQTVWFFACTDA